MIEQVEQKQPPSKKAEASDMSLALLLIKDLNDGFTLLVETYEPLLYDVALRILLDHTSAEDVVQQAIINAYTDLKNCSEEKLRTLKVKAWLCRIVQNAAYNYKRKKLHWIEKLEALDLPEASHFFEIEGKKIEQPEVAVLRNESRLALRKIVAMLPLQYREIMTLRFFEGYNYLEIAEQLNCPIGSVKGWIARGIDLLYDLAEDNNIEMSDIMVWCIRAKREPSEDG